MRGYTMLDGRCDAEKEYCNFRIVIKPYRRAVDKNKNLYYYFSLYL